MNDKLLREAREEINAVDEEMARLFCRRMAACRKVAQYKKETGMPVFDPAREEAVIARGAPRVEESLRGYYIHFLHANMEIAKAYQSRLLDGMHAAFAGKPGAFAEIAARRILPAATPIAYEDFAAAYRAVEEGRCDVAVLPLENSTNGDVGTVMDLAFFGSLTINGVYDLTIEQNLLALPDAKISDIKTVISHPQALGQCSAFLKEGGFDTRESATTATAAKLVAESGDRSLAAIGSAEAAEQFGLQVLRGRIHDKGGNTTRFAVFSQTAKAPSPSDGQFIMGFTVKNEAGALAKAISAIGEGGFNLRAIKSRPTKKLSWDYYFFCEGDGNIRTPAGEAMLERLKEDCNDLKILGSFEKEMTV
ncbi:MAG: chorismate mutase [Clostridia bacterium]|nr:chorismate mutase [Clostridia bacterium]